VFEQLDGPEGGAALQSLPELAARLSAAYTAGTMRAFKEDARFIIIFLSSNFFFFFFSRFYRQRRKRRLGCRQSKVQRRRARAESAGYVPRPEKKKRRK